MVRVRAGVPPGHSGAGQATAIEFITLSVAVAVQPVASVTKTVKLPTIFVVILAPLLV